MDFDSLFLGGVVVAFVLFGVVLGGVTVWSNARPAARRARQPEPADGSLA